MASKLFAFSRPLPAPFSGTRSKKVAVSSKYGDGTEATLTATVLKGVLAYCGCKTGAEEGAVGQLGQKGVAEYKSKAGPDAFHLAVYDPSSGSVLASVYDKNTEMMETYACNTSGKDGAAIVLAMLPTLMEDDEFHDTLDAFEKEYVSQGYETNRSIEETLNIGWKLLSILPKTELKRIKPEFIEKYLPKETDGQ